MTNLLIIETRLIDEADHKSHNMLRKIKKQMLMTILYPNLIIMEVEVQAQKKVPKIDSKSLIIVRYTLVVSRMMLKVAT